MENVFSWLSVPSLRAAAYSRQLLAEVGRNLQAIRDSKNVRKSGVEQLQIREEIIAELQKQSGEVGDIRFLDYAAKLREINAEIERVSALGFVEAVERRLNGEAQEFISRIDNFRSEIGRRARVAGIVYILLLLLVVTYMVAFIVEAFRGGGS